MLLQLIDEKMENIKLCIKTELEMDLPNIKEYF